MPDPGFVSALIAEIVHLAIQEAGKVVMCREYCRQLAEMVDSSVKPVVAEFENNLQFKSVVADNWLTRLQACLEDAQAVIIECRSVHSFNVLVKYRLSHRILSILVKIRELHVSASGLSVALSATVVTQCSEVLRLLQDNYRYVSLAAKTCGCTQSESYSKDRAIFEITHEATSYSAGLGVVDEPTIELQPIPKLVFGLDELSSQLEAALRDGPGSQWVGVWGKGGSGKTLLTQTVSNSLSVNNHFGGEVYWVTVARNPNIPSLQSRLCKRIGRGEQLFASEEVGRQTLIKYLKNIKVLLILDDVWDGGVLQWFDVVEARGSKILVTSRNNTVFDRVSYASTVIEVKLLSEVHSWDLFCSYAFPGQDRQQLQHNMEPILAERVKQVVSECKGLPLALKVIGGIMAGKQQLGSWDTTLRKLQNVEVLNEEQEKQVYQRLKLSYDELVMIDKARGRALQECFLYFAAFPEDAIIEVEQLIGYWIGEGLIGYKDDEDPQVEAYYILGQLIGRSLVDLEVGWTHSQSTKFFSCKIHDVLRDLGIYILENQKEATEYACLFLSGRKFPTGAGQKKFNAKKLSLIGDQVENINKLGIRAPDVEVLLLSNNSQLKHLTGGFLRSFRKLRVLGLSRTDLISLPTDIGKLKELVVLDISYSSVRSVPDSLGRLTKLEHLNMQNCRLESFPADKVSKLVNLRYLNARGCGDIWDQRRHGPCSCVALEQVPVQGLENLAALQMLTRLWISSRTRERLPGMSYSTRLVHLSLYFEKLSVIPEELQTLAALEVLDVNTCRALQKLPDYLSRSFLGLLVLDLRGCTSLTHLPSDLQQLQWLQKLDLEGCQSLQSLPDAFGSSGAFPSLQELFVTGCSRLEAFPELQPGALPRLCVLKLAFCERPQRLVIHPKALPNLVRLNLSGCAGLKELPDEEVWRCFSYLEELVLNNMQISGLPVSIGLLPSLKKLEMKQCKQLKALPWVDIDSSTGDYFIRLEEISMQGTPIRELPKVLAAAPQLRKMDLTDCDITLTNEVFGLLKAKNVRLKFQARDLNEAKIGHAEEADKEEPSTKQKSETGEAAENTSETNGDQHNSAIIMDPSSSGCKTTPWTPNNFLDWLAQLIDESSIDEDPDHQNLLANSYDSGHLRRVNLQDMQLQHFKRGLEDHLVLGSCSGDVITEEVLKNLACTSWNMHSYVGARLLANGFFELAFTDSLDVQKLLQKRFAKYEGRVILFQPFQQGFNPNEAGNLKAVWVGLPLLPTDCLHPQVFMAVGNTLGSYLAYELDVDGGRLPRVCLACTIQQEQELPSELELVLPSGKLLQRLVRI